MARLKNSKDLWEEIEKKQAEADAIWALAESEERDLTDDEKAAFDTIAGCGNEGEDGYKPGEIGKLRAELARAEKREKLVAENLQARKIQDRFESGELKFGNQPQDRQITVPAKAKASGRMKAYSEERDAYIAGTALLAGLFNHRPSIERMEDWGIRNAMSEGIGTKGGFFVPEEMQRALVRLREERGVFPRYARSYPMASDSLFVPRDLQDVTAYWVGENEEITESDKTFAAAELTAKKLACLTRISSELDEDAVVDIGDMVTTSMAYSMADKIDEAGFNGDGTSTYGGVVGLKTALTDEAAIYTTGAGVDTFGELVLTDFETAIGQLPRYPGMTPVWFMHSAAYYASMARLMYAAGGNTGADIANGGQMMFMGYPVVFTQVLPSSTGDLSGQFFGYFGDLGLAATMGVRRNVRTEVSTDRYFEYDQIGIKATERIAITVHERGDTIKNRPIIALKFNAS